MDPRKPRPWSRALVCAAAVTSLILVGCGEASDSGGPDGAGAQAEAEAASYPLTVTAANGQVTIEEQPTRIVSLSATATEMLFGIGAGEQVVAVDDNSNYPPEAPMTDLSGFDVNVEAIAGYDPDLVVYSSDPGGLQKALNELEIPAIMQPAAVTLDDTYSQIEQLGDATGHPTEAERLNAEIEGDVQALTEEVGDSGDGLTYYYELDTNLFSVTSATFIGEVFGLLGLENIADEADEDGTGYPQLSAEYILDQDPDLIFLADTKCCDQSAETVAQRPGWDGLSAVENGAIVELDDDVASRWGPRVVELLDLAAGAVADVEEAAA